MAITQSALAHAIARDFARSVPPEAHLTRLWVWSEHGHVHPDYDYVDLTAFVDPVDAEAEDRIFQATTSLTEAYPDVQIMVWPVGPNAAGGQTPAQWVNPKAEEISLKHLGDE